MLWKAIFSHETVAFHRLWIQSAPKEDTPRRILRCYGCHDSMVRMDCDDSAILSFRKAWSSRKRHWDNASHVTYVDLAQSVWCCYWRCHLWQLCHAVFHAHWFQRGTVPAWLSRSISTMSKSPIAVSRKTSTALISVSLFQHLETSGEIMNTDSKISLSNMDMHMI